MAVRLKDIAQDLGVSLMTVSKALRNHPDISEGTRKRVLKRIEELNYQPNLAARALVTGKTHLMGLVVPDLVHPFFSQIANAISKELREQRYSLVITSSQEDPELEQQRLDLELDRRRHVRAPAWRAGDESIASELPVQFNVEHRVHGMPIRRNRAFHLRRQPRR